MVFALLRSMKIKFMVGVAFVLFVPTAISQNGGSWAISVIRESRAERILVRTCLVVRLMVIEVMVKFPYPLLLIRWSKLIISLNVRNYILLVSFLF